MVDNPNAETMNNPETNPMIEDLYRQFIYYRTYSRYNQDLGRRETWPETVDRYMKFMRENLSRQYVVPSLKALYDLTDAEFEEIRTSILKQEVMPSMRLLWSAGGPAERCNACCYNCAYLAVESFRDMAEALYLLCSGCGVGFSVEKRSIDRLPKIWPQKKAVPAKYFIVDDNKEGWADALLFGLNTWSSGEDVIFDYSQIRPQGARLKTMGGRASGPQPLIELLDLTRDIIFAREGQDLRPIDVHHIMTKIGDCVVSGGVRRSAMISLSDLEDDDIRHCKDGKFWEEAPHLALANNSTVYTEKPTEERFAEEWAALKASKSGERGIFNRGSLKKQVPERRWKAWVGLGITLPVSIGRPSPNLNKVQSPVGVNPCGEIILLSHQFCNLTEVVAREGDTASDLERKVRIAAIIGTYQSTLTDFKYLNDSWRRNCEAEHLVGVSITGQWDCEAAREPSVLRKLKDIVIKTTEQYAIRFDITAPTATTCCKPSGTVSQLVNSSSGLHTRFSNYYVRRVRITATDPLFKMLRDQGVPYCAEVGQDMETATTYVLEFPIKSPDGVKTNESQSAIQQLEHWLVLKENFTEHNPSCTIFIKNGEWDEVRDWVWKHWDKIGGLSFLPFSDAVYEKPPFQAITKKEYEGLLETMPKIDFSLLGKYEQEDNTEGAKTFACAGNVCEVVDSPAPVV